MRAYLIAPLVALASPAAAGELVVQLRTANGAPVRDAVVTLYPDGRTAPLAPPARVFQIAQRDIRFTPFVLVVPVGAQVAFPNFDNVRHHVYSFSPVKKFELKLYAKEQDRPVRFDKPGVVPIGCNIHDQMTAFVKVVDTGLAVQSDASGRALFATVPAGPVVARIWHPYLRAPGNQVELRLTAGAGRQLRNLTLNLRSPPPAGGSY
ncbi:MAG TPA: methylamine utilization protein [Allosphingosinicella sp.]|nr:methylamine utilization protein [Allosphingosinicella sp.]